MTDLVFPPSLESLQRRLAEVNPHLVDLIRFFQPMRQELLQRRADFARRTFEEQTRPQEETRAIREADWAAEGERVAAFVRLGSKAEWIDFESDPELTSRFTLRLYRHAFSSAPTWVRTHSLLHEEREITYQGRHVSGFLLNLALLGKTHVLVVPKIENRFEARALSEVLHFYRARTGVRPRIGVEFETLQGAVEADEIFFELKEFVVVATFDPLDYLSNLIRKLSTDHASFLNPFQESDRQGILAPIQNHLAKLSKRRQVEWITHPSAEDLPAQTAETRPYPALPKFRKPGDAETRSLIHEGMAYLLSAFEATESSGEAELPSVPFARFEFCRSVLWQWIHHEVITEEAYFRLRDLEKQAFGGRSSEVAGQLLDSLLLNGNFVEFAGAYYDLHRRNQPRFAASS